MYAGRRQRRRHENGYRRRRSRTGYFTDKPTNSDLTLVDDDTLVMVTTYDGTTYREEIRMLFEDSVRLRQTVATSGDKITLVGQYFEERVVD